MLKLLRSKQRLSLGTATKPATVESRGQERRRNLKAGMPRSPLADQHTEGAKLLPTRQSLLSKIPAGGTACEIGVSRGDFSSDILAINRPKKLHLVDAWDSERYAPHFQEVLERFAGELRRNIVEINRGLSTEVLSTFPDQYFDWVYIDTNHSFDTTSAELDLCKRKVKPGGRIAGHDFCTGNVVTPVPYGVIEACHDFCLREHWRYEFLSLDPDGHFSFCLIKIT